jgi:hypothetical protein
MIFLLDRAVTTIYSVNMKYGGRDRGKYPFQTRVDTRARVLFCKKTDFHISHFTVNYKDKRIERLDGQTISPIHSLSLSLSTC